MPLYKTINHSSFTTIYIWKIEESLQWFLDTVAMNENSQLRAGKMKSESHKKGFLAVRKLLDVAGYTDFDLFYTPDGKPHLKDGKKISISHSFDFSVIAISNQVLGVDIERNREKIKRISHKFIGQEQTFLKNETLVEQLTVVWGAKESLFKIHPDGGLLFIEHLPIAPFQIEDKKTKGYIVKPPLQEEYAMYFDIFEGYSLVYATNDLPAN